MEKFDDDILTYLYEDPSTYHSKNALLILCDIKSERYLRNKVRKLIKKGYPICANSKHTGYKIGTKEEIKHCNNERIHRALDLLETSLVQYQYLRKDKKYKHIKNFVNSYNDLFKQGK